MTLLAGVARTNLDCSQFKEERERERKSIILWMPVVPFVGWVFCQQDSGLCLIWCGHLVARTSPLPQITMLQLQWPHPELAPRAAADLKNLYRSLLEAPSLSLSLSL
jgi:hypothetical protein